MEHELKTFSLECIEEGHYLLSYSGTAVVVPAIDMQRGKEVLKKVDDSTLTEPKTWIKEHKGTHKGCGRISDAMIIADAIRGRSIKDILNTKYPYKRNRSGSSNNPYCYRTYSRGKVFAALSVNKPEDYDRICSLLLKYPKVFEGIQYQDVFNWMKKRSRKE